MFDLVGKSALVTGASGGLGEAIARGLHARGASVCLSGTRAERLEALAADLGARAHAAPCNLGDLDAVDALPKRAEEACGGLDILVSNAGVTRDNVFLRMKPEEWDDVLAVNLTAYFRLAKAALRGMMKRRFGRIIGVTSVVGVTGNPGQANYAASKAGMIGFTRSIAKELAGKNITANVVAPGFIETEMTENLPEAVKDAVKTMTAMKRMGRAEEIAAAVAFLAAESASYVTGQVLAVDGGMTMS